MTDDVQSLCERLRAGIGRGPLTPWGKTIMDAAEMLAVTETGYQTICKKNDELQALTKEMTFILDTTISAIEHFWGDGGLDKVRRHIRMARKSRETNAEIDELEKVFGLAPLAPAALGKTTESK